MKSGTVVRLNDEKMLSVLHPDVVVSLEKITPKTAADWLRCNRLNRPVRRAHVAFLAGEIERGLWQLNGQAIIISEDEDVLDGQHRLLAIIEAGKAIETLVVYGVTKTAFETIDTGLVRTGADALSVFFPGRQQNTVKAVGTAVPLCLSLERKAASMKRKVPNADVITYVKEHPSLWQCATEVLSYPKDARVLSSGVSTALYEMFQRKNAEDAARFIRDITTGEMLIKESPEYLLRSILARDTQRTSKYPMAARMRMTVKAWNLRRRNIRETSRSAISLYPADTEEIIIL